MRSPVTGIVALFLLFVVLIVAYSSVFTVAQTEQVLVVRLGEPVRVVTEPGLNFKAPFIDTVISIDKRILDLENPSQEVIASDQKRLVVDAFARYRIKNALRFYQSVGSIQAANIQLTTLLNAALRRVLGEVTFITVVRADREATVIVAEANSTAEQVRGTGDGERNRLFAEAYGKDPDFFAFYRSMTAYENGLKSNDTRFLLRPDSEFFRFFGTASGHTAAAPAQPPANAAPKP